MSGQPQISHGVIRKDDYWRTLSEMQPWITNNQSFVDIVEEKLKIFSHD